MGIHNISALQNICIDGHGFGLLWGLLCSGMGYSAKQKWCSAGFGPFWDGVRLLCGSDLSLSIRTYIYG